MGCAEQHNLLNDLFIKFSVTLNFDMDDILVFLTSKALLILALLTIFGEKEIHVFRTLITSNDTKPLSDKIKTILNYS